LSLFDIKKTKKRYKQSFKLEQSFKFVSILIQLLEILSAYVYVYIFILERFIINFFVINFL